MTNRFITKGAKCTEVQFELRVQRRRQRSGNCKAKAQRTGTESISGVQDGVHGDLDGTDG